MQVLRSESKIDWADFTDWMLMAQHADASLDDTPIMGIKVHLILGLGTNNNSQSQK